MYMTNRLKMKITINEQKHENLDFKYLQLLLLICSCFYSGCNHTFLTPSGHTLIIVTFIIISEIGVNDPQICNCIKIKLTKTKKCVEKRQR